MNLSLHGATVKITSDGQVSYDASTLDPSFIASLQSLGAGEVAADTFTYAIRLANGTLSWATASVQIAGVNDAATISGASSGNVTEDGGLTAMGTLTVVDPDHDQSHTQIATNAASSGGLGTYSVDADGHWSFTVDNSAIQSLGANDTTSDSFIVTSLDGTATQVVTIIIHGSNDAPVITSGAQSGNVSEGDDGSNQSATGQVTFTDVDLSDSHSLSVSVAASHGTASFDADGTWHYTVSDSGAVDALAAGEHLADSFTVQVDDGQGGLAIQTVSIDIVGTNDAPVITSGAQSGNVSKGDDGSNQSATGQVTFTDIDLSDSHSLSVSVAASHGTASVDADGTWHYTVSDSGAVDALAAGEHLADSFTVQVDDGQGGLATQTVSIDIVGTNDAPVITSGAQSGNVSEGDDGSNQSATGQVTFTDIDLSDSHSLSVSVAANHGTASVDADGRGTTR